MKPDMDEPRLKDKVALVTGAAGGLGRSICELLAKDGAAVVLADIDPIALRNRTSEFDREGIRTALQVECDVSSPDSVRSMMDEVSKTCGRLDILVNNAGGSLHIPRDLEQIGESDWDKVIGVNLKGTFLCCQAAVPLLKQTGAGSIVNMASIAGRTGSPVSSVAYAAAKGGIIALTRRIAVEVAKDNIRANAVAPGFIFSGPRLEKLWESQTEEQKRMVLNSIPLGRHGTPDDVASAVLFLASSRSAWMTGAIIDVNGGRFIG